MPTSTHDTGRHHQPECKEGTKPQPENWAGQLRLNIAQRQGTSYAASQYHEGALRILRPHYLDKSGQVNYTIINPGGAYFGADRYLLDLTIQDQASLVLTTQSATKIYKTPQGPAYQQLTAKLGEGAVLEYVPDQLILYRQGAYRQSSSIDMDPTASLALAEIITPGWAPDGSSFGYEELWMRTEVRVTGPAGPKRLAVDQLRLRPSDYTDIQGIGLMEGYSHTGQLLIADARIDQALYERIATVAEESPTRSGVSRIGGDNTYGVKALIVRSLAQSTGEIMSLQHSIIDEIRALWRGQGPLDLRKY
ncbi:urease accessory protein UreD [Rothia sp. 88186D007BW]